MPFIAELRAIQSIINVTRGNQIYLNIEICVTRLGINFFIRINFSTIVARASTCTTFMKLSYSFLRYPMERKMRNRTRNKFSLLINIYRRNEITINYKKNKSKMHLKFDFRSFEGHHV